MSDIVSNAENAEASMRERILQILTVYPRISKPMLQVGIGTSTSPRMWKPILNSMVQEGIIIEAHIPATSPTGRHISYSVISLRENAVQGQEVQRAIAAA